MTFHLASFVGLQGPGTLARVSPTTDTQLYSVDDRIVLPCPMDLVCAFGMGSSLQTAKVTSPILRGVNPINVSPLVIGASIPSTPNVAYFGHDAIHLQRDEPITFEASGVGQSLARGLVWLEEKFEPVPSGDRFWVRMTSSAFVPVSDVWWPMQLTSVDELAAGTYAVIGMQYASPTGIAARLTFDHQYWKPGVLATQSPSARSFQQSYDGSFGLWGTFRTSSLPRLEVLLSSSDNTHEVRLLVVRVGG